MAFRTIGTMSCIPRNDHFIWSQLQEMTPLQYPIPNLAKATLEVEVDWRFAGHKSQLIGIHTWMVEHDNKEWGIEKYNRW